MNIGRMPDTKIRDTKANDMIKFSQNALVIFALPKYPYSLSTVVLVSIRTCNTVQLHFDCVCVLTGSFQRLVLAFYLVLPEPFISK